MKKMASFTTGSQTWCKPKLPRKRKKAAIKVEGRNWYLDTIKLWKVCQDDPRTRGLEPKCKFWVNALVINCPIVLPNGQIFLQPTPTRFW